MRQRDLTRKENRLPVLHFWERLFVFRLGRIRKDHHGVTRKQPGSGCELRNVGDGSGSRLQDPSDQETCPRPPSGSSEMFPPRPQGEDPASTPPHLLSDERSFFTSKLLRSSKRPSSKVPAPSLSVLSVCVQPCRCVRAQTKQAPGLWTFRVIGGGVVGEGGSFRAGPAVLDPFTSPTAVKLHRSNQRPSALQMCEEPLLDLPGVAGSFYRLWWKHLPGSDVVRSGI